MKHIFAYTLSFVAIAASALLLTNSSRAEDPVLPDTITRYHAEGGVSTSKDVSTQNSDGSYTITLETFATGSSSLVKTTKPADIILVLDTSSSMDQNDYTYKGVSMKRWRALRATVTEFVQTIYESAVEARSKDSSFEGHRVAIITYNRNALNITGGWLDIEDVITKNGSTYGGSLIQTININNPGGVWANYNGQGGTDRNKESTSGTRPDHGLEMAIDQLLDGSDAAKRENANLTVVMFTDGYPTDSYGSYWGEPNDAQNQNKFDWAFANKTLYYGNVIKTVYGAAFYTIGLITTPPNGRPNNPATATGETGWRWRNYVRVNAMMEWLSSNYPKSKWTASTSNLVIETGGYTGHTGSTDVLTRDNVPAPWKNEWEFHAGTNAATDYITLSGFDPGDKITIDDDHPSYSTIVDDNTSFDKVFQDIASASSKTDATVGATTQVRDVVSSSFVLPEGASSDLSKLNLKVFTEDIKSDGSTWINRTQIYPRNSSTPSDAPVLNPSVQTLNGHEAVYVEGFDYTKEDNPANSGNGNWVGPRYDANSNLFYAGKKLVIQFDIFVDGDATGGQGTNTNTSDSGVYILQEDGTYKNINHYDVPHTTVPINIIIKKTGLRHGESATFQILRAPILLDDDGNIQYNALGKAKPNEDEWGDFSKVIVTNKGENGAAVIKTLLSLDPGFVYKVTEDQWGWAYTMTGQGGTLTTADVELNPFIFNNDEEEDAAKHAEAVTVNHFESPAYGGSKVEHYKSSKVESF